MNVLKGKVAIVTGASSGIGRAVARLFACEGACLVVAARRESELLQLVAEIEQCAGQAIAITGDVRDEAVAERLVVAARAQFGGLDIAVNNVGSTGEIAAVQDLSAGGWHSTLETNLTSAFLGAKYQIPAMAARGGGSLIFTSSFVGYSSGFPGMAAYAAAKAGLVGLVRVLAVECGAQRIRANAVLPGAVDTAANVANDPAAPPGTRAFIEHLHALKRMATPEEIAGSMLYLASDASTFITGAAIPVDGGVSISRT